MGALRPRPRSLRDADPWRSSRGIKFRYASRRGSARLVLLGEPFHRADRPCVWQGSGNPRRGRRLWLPGAQAGSAALQCRGPPPQWGRPYSIFAEKTARTVAARTTIRIAGGAAFSLCRAQRRRSRKRRSLVKKSVRSRRVSVSGSGKVLCLVPGDEPQSRCLTAGLNRRRVSGAVEPAYRYGRACPGHHGIEPWPFPWTPGTNPGRPSKAIFAPQCVPPATTATPWGSGPELWDQLRPAVQ
jgi:hypothetical protein